MKDHTKVTQKVVDPDSNVKLQNNTAVLTLVFLLLFVNFLFVTTQFGPYTE